nr:MAG TPA: hypothetical protein [Caudoviricetes sp.]DAQ86532.1 MAG TPA: hypothetical protein [Caudoviricetes sp.]
MEYLLQISNRDCGIRNRHKSLTKVGDLCFLT